MFQTSLMTTRLRPVPLAIATIAGLAPAEINTWTGASGSDTFYDWRNWSLEVAPGASHDIVLPSSFEPYEVVSAFDERVRSLVINDEDAFFGFRGNSNDEEVVFQVDKTTLNRGEMRVFTFGGAITLELREGLVNHGLVRFQTGEHAPSIRGPITNESDGLILSQHDSTTFSGLTLPTQDLDVFHNKGEIRATSDITLVNIDLQNTDDGRLDVSEHARLTFGARSVFSFLGGTLVGDVHMDRGSSLSFGAPTGPGVIHLEDPDVSLLSDVPNGVHLRSLGTGMIIAEDLTFDGLLEARRRGINLDRVNTIEIRPGVTMTNTGDLLTQDKGVIESSGTLHNAGYILYDISEMGDDLVPHRHDGTLTNLTSGLLDITGPLDFGDDGILVNRGEIDTLQGFVVRNRFDMVEGVLSIAGRHATVEGGLFRFVGGDIVGPGSLLLHDATCELSASAGTGLLEVKGESQVRGDIGDEITVRMNGSTLVIPDSLRNEGTIDTNFVTSDGGILHVYQGAVLTNAGQIIFRDPSVLRGHVSNLGTLRTDDELVVEGTLSTSPSSRLTGFGRFVLDAGSLVNHGVVSPGRDSTSGTHSIGRLEIDGDLVSTPTAHHIVEVGGGPFIETDAVHVLGNVTLQSSRLTVVDAGGWEPADGDSFTILSANGFVSGTFHGYEDGDVVFSIGDIDVEIHYAPDRVELVAIDTSPACGPADLAEPFGEHDIFDVVVFLGLFEIESPDADFNSDGLHDIFDVVAFLEAFETGCVE